MTIPRLMLFGFIVLVLLGGILYAVIASYEPPDVGLEFDVKNLAQYPLDKSNFHTDGGNYVLNFMPDFLIIYGLEQYDATWEAARELGLSHHDLSDDWVDYGSHKTYKVDIKADIATIYEVEFCRRVRWIDAERSDFSGGYETATVKFRYE